MDILSKTDILLKNIKIHSFLKFIFNNKNIIKMDILLFLLFYILLLFIKNGLKTVVIDVNLT